MGRKHIVMVIDADANSRRQTIDLLHDGPYAVAADTGFDPDTLALAAEVRPDAILVSLEPPLDDAIDTLAAFRRDLPDVHLVGYAPAGDLPTVRRLLRDSVRDFLATPLRPRDLDAVICGEPVAARPRSAPLSLVEAPRGRVITVFGAKGGTGKSTIATNLAAAFAAEGASACLLDMDSRFGDLAGLLGLRPDTTIADLAPHAGRLTPEHVRRALTHHDSGVALLAAPHHPADWGGISGDHVEAIVAATQALFDFTLLDTPGSFNDIVAAAVDRADHVLLVTGLDMASIKDTAHMLDLLDAERYPAGQVHLVVNQTHATAPIRPGDVGGIVGQSVAARIAYDPNVVKASGSGQPLVLAKPNAPAAQDIRRLARLFLGDARGQDATAVRRWIAAPLHRFRRGQAV